MAVAALVLAALVLPAGCSDPKAAPLPSPSPTPSTVAPTTASPTPSADYEAEARRAVDAYFAALNAALRDPAERTDALAALIDPNCTCMRVVEALRSQARAGRYLDYTYSIRDVRVQQAGSLGASLTFVAQQSAGHERSRDGRVVRAFPASTVRYSAHFRRTSSGWRLDRLDQIR